MLGHKSLLYQFPTTTSVIHFSFVLGTPSQSYLRGLLFPFDTLPTQQEIITLSLKHLRLLFFLLFTPYNSPPAPSNSFKIQELEVIPRSLPWSFVAPHSAHYPVLSIPFTDYIAQATQFHRMNHYVDEEEPEWMQIPVSLDLSFS